MDVRSPGPLVYIVDDDWSVRHALGRLLRSAGLPNEAFGSVEDFLADVGRTENACVVADLRMSGTSALALPAILRRRGSEMPVIILTAQDSGRTRTAAKEAGVAAYFHKPVDDQALLDAIAWVLRNGSTEW
jgi:FixJ family two-component response regulator